MNKTEKTIIRIYVRIESLKAVNCSQKDKKLINVKWAIKKEMQVEPDTKM